MLRHWRFLAFLPLAAVAAICLLPAPRAHGYVEAPHSFGQIIALSSNVVLMRVTAVDRVNNRVIYAKVRDLKGVHKQQEIRHNIGKAGFEPREWQNVMNWAETGKEAVFFHNGNASETCIGLYWYQSYGNANDVNGWWGMSHGEPYLLRSFAGRIDKLVSAVTDVVSGKEVIVPCMLNSSNDDLKAARAKIQRLKASLKLQNYDPKRDFVGWGGEDFRRIVGLPGFTHISALTRVDPDAQSVSAVDFNADGKPDICLAGAARVALLQNGGDSLGEVSLPGTTGTRSAVWADYNGDGLPDLLLAVPTGPKLYTNLGKGAFRDDSHLLPKEAGYNVTCAAWIDQDGDGRPDILLGNGWHGLRLYRNKGKADVKPPLGAGQWHFEDVSDAVGLGADGIGSTKKGDTLTVCDLDGDGRADFLYGAGTGLVVRNTGSSFEVVKDSGISYPAGKVGPVFGDFNADGLPDLFIATPAGCKLFRNDGKMRFTDVTEKAGLAESDGGDKPRRSPGRATCAAWGDIDNDGRLDLIVGCLRGPNRFLRNKGDGTFEDATEKLGLHTRVFNTQAICLADLNGDGVLDMVFNNEGQDACVLLGNPETLVKHTLVTLQLASRLAVVGSRVRILGEDGKSLAAHHVSGGDGRGGQAWPVARFALPPGKYRVEVMLSDGEKRAREITVASNHLRSTLDDKTPKME